MPAGNYEAGSRRPGDVPWIILHTTEGDLDSSIDWFKNSSSGVSTHYIIARDGTVYQLVHNQDVAYHAGNLAYNVQAFGVEIERYADNAITDAQFSAAAELVKALAEIYGIPLDHPTGIAPADPTSGPGGIIGHDQVPDPNNPALGGGASHHTDPIMWDWARFERLLGISPMLGDATGDRRVDFNDLVVLAQNYNSMGGKHWSDGDFTGDGNVDFNDLVILAQRYNSSLAAPVAAPVPAPAPVKPKTAKPVFSVTPVAKP